MPRTPISAKPVADDPATLYALRVVDGKKVAGAFEIAACKRHLRDLDNASKLGFSFDVDYAKFMCNFFPSMLRVTEGTAEGKPFFLLPWQGFVSGSIHGWKRSDGLRRFRMAWMETGKGQAKSPFMAGLGIQMLGYAGKKRAEIYAIAGDKDQANVIFKDSVAMCRANLPDRDEDLDEFDSLESLGEVVIRGTGDHAWKIEHPATGSKYQSIASADSISGPRPYCILADEIHEFKNAYALQTWKAAIDKMSGDPLMVLGTNTPSSDQIVGTEYSELFQKVLLGQADDDTLFGFIARVDERDRETVFDNEACWEKALPALGITFPIENVRSRVKTAKIMLNEALSTKRLYFGIPVGSDGFWTTEEAWNSCQGKVDEKGMVGHDCWLSLDLSKKNDLTALSAVWRKEGRLYVKTWYFTVKKGLAERSRRDNAMYEDWEALGYLTALKGATVDYRFVANKVSELVETHNVKFLAFDPAKMADFIDACDDESVNLKVWQYDGPDKPRGKGLMLVRHGQGTRVVFTERALSMPRSIEKLEDEILNGNITIDKNPVTSMCASNALIISDAMNNRAFDKKRSRGRIDGMISIAEGVGAAHNEFPALEKTYKMAALGG